MMVTDDLRADIQNILRKETDRGLVREYAIMLETMRIDGVIDSFMIDTYGDVLEMLQDEICRRFCNRVVAECQA